MTLEEKELQDIEEIGKLAQGKNELVRYLKGGKLSALQAIKAYCYWCNGYCSDGRETCEEKSCALWPHNPYTEKEKQARSEKQMEQTRKLSGLCSRSPKKAGNEHPRINF